MICHQLRLTFIELTIRHFSFRFNRNIVRQPKDIIHLDHITTQLSDKLFTSSLSQFHLVFLLFIFVFVSITATCVHNTYICMLRTFLIRHKRTKKRNRKFSSFFMADRRHTMLLDVITFLVHNLRNIIPLDRPCVRKCCCHCFAFNILCNAGKLSSISSFHRFCCSFCP